MVTMAILGHVANIDYQNVPDIFEEKSPSAKFGRELGVAELDVRKQK